jgi:hypothetical protein
MTEVPTGKVPKPYILHKASSEMFEVKFKVHYAKADIVCKACYAIYEIVAKPSS